MSERTHDHEDQASAFALPDNAIRWTARKELAEDSDDLAICLTREVYEAICDHLGADLENELGGFMIGKVHAEPDSGRTIAVIDACTKAQHTEGSSTRLRFGNDTWLALQEEMESQFAGKQLIGWYHSHPRMSVFFSSYDLFIHKNFFRETWQVGLVVEPERGLGGFFRWRNGDVDPETYVGFYELVDPEGKSVVQWLNLRRSDAAGEPSPEPPPPPPPEPAAPEPPAPAPAVDTRMSAKLTLMTKQLRDLQITLFVLCILAVLILFGMVLRLRGIEDRLDRLASEVAKLSASIAQTHSVNANLQRQSLAEIRSIRRHIHAPLLVAPAARSQAGPAAAQVP